MARLNLNFTPLTAGWILYEGGNRISSGQRNADGEREEDSSTGSRVEPCHYRLIRGRPSRRLERQDQ